MIETTTWTFAGSEGGIAARSWIDDTATISHLVVLVHGYGEHVGRYDHVARALVDNGAAVYGLDHIGHGASDGERVVVSDFEHVVDDVHSLVVAARTQRPGLPIVMIGHSMGGMIAARYAQRFGDGLTALVLSGPAVGEFDLVDQILALDEIPDIPLDPDVLSRDPAVGAAYAADPLVWHGPFKRPTLAAMSSMIATISAGGSLGELPLMWIHGADDQLVPIEGSRAGIEQLRGSSFRKHEYAGARHEVFNETNNDEVIADTVAFIDDVLAGRAV